jgi:hypothetical protein
MDRKYFRYSFNVNYYEFANDNVEAVPTVQRQTLIAERKIDLTFKYYFLNVSSLQRHPS